MANASMMCCWTFGELDQYDNRQSINQAMKEKCHERVNQIELSNDSVELVQADNNDASSSNLTCDCEHACHKTSAIHNIINTYNTISKESSPIYIEHLSGPVTQSIDYPPKLI